MSIENIAAFGGCPYNVVIGGFIAGAMSAFGYRIVNGDKGNGLFRSITMSSGSLLGFENVPSGKALEIYNTIVRRAGCASANSLSCLRSLITDKLLEASVSLNTGLKWLGGNSPYIPRPDSRGSFFPLTGDAAIASGKYAKVLVPTGNSENEGTLFAPTQSNITNCKLLADYLSMYFPGNSACTAYLVSR